MNSITSPIKNNPLKKINDYYSALKSTISVPIVDPSKYSTLLLKKQLHDETHPSSNDKMDILDNETVITEKLTPKMNSIRIIMMFKISGKRR